jgi:hypothetical protein
MSVSPDELLYLARELARLMGSALRHDVTVHARLRVLIHEQRNAVRGLIEDKIVSRLPGSVGGGGGAAAVPVTAGDLKKAGLTLEAIVGKDATLTGRALVLAGVISAHEHLADLGVYTFADMVRLIGRPRELAQWLHDATGRNAQAWRTNFLPHLKFDFNAWLQTRTMLQPGDLTFLEFWLCAHLDAHPRECWPLALTDTDKWLTVAPRDEWIRAQQLREDQYLRLCARSS